MEKKTFSGCLIAFAFFIVLFIVLFIITISGVKNLFTDECLSKDEIFDTVNKNHHIIINDIHKGEFTKTESIEGIEKISCHDGVINFFCGGKGISVSGTEYGFYYTEDDLPKVSFLTYISFSEEDLVPEKKGYCLNKKDYYYTEKVRDNFYYYESHF